MYCRRILRLFLAHLPAFSLSDAKFLLSSSFSSNLSKLKKKTSSAVRYNPMSLYNSSFSAVNSISSHSIKAECFLVVVVVQ